ncbi:hypothetical protein EK21DRAFT_63543, partial [Setomelanomma holmii]
ITDQLIYRLVKVEAQMHSFRDYIRTQKDEDKPLYQWIKYSGYPALGAAVLELDNAMIKAKRTRLPQESLSTSLARAMDASTAVSRAASYALGVMNKKTAKYVEEMVDSTLSEETRTQANQLITEELRKLIEHTTRATERVWVATDLLRNCHQKRTCGSKWAWSVAGTIMTATVSAVVGIITAHVYGPAGFDLVLMSGAGGVVYTQVLGLLQRAQDVTNLTGELYLMKLQDLGQRFDNLTAISESYGLRIDNLVDALGPPNEEGVYYLSKPKTTEEPCKTIEGHLKEVSDDVARQLKRLHDEMEVMRKNMNRMDIRLTTRLNKLRKD